MRCDGTRRAPPRPAPRSPAASRPPRGARRRRGRSGGRAARSPRPGRRPTDQPLTTSPSPSRSTPWWWWDMTTQPVGPGGAAGERSPAPAAPGASPKVPATVRWRLVADRLRQVLVERAAERDVEQLHPAADPEQRHVALQRPPRQRELEGVALGPGALRLRVRLGAVAGRVDVGAAGQEQRVDAVEQHVGVARPRPRRAAGRSPARRPAAPRVT